ncbi:response regulator [Agaribacterium haliotis]|uniref:response regulator n=1 Tax=Agaribacterium haliotis TaxID=2013869 RepID=UPI000BB58258|nr:response regulator [Agaribacterium haliotis]
MANNKLIISIIDDNPSDIQLLIDTLKDNYQVNAALSAKEAFAQYQQQQPDLILLDINMPDIDGYEACRQLKDNSELKHIDIIFLSANDHTDEIIKGLELGALDYIVKPYDTELLLHKIKAAVDRLESTKQLQQQAQEANQIVYTMLGESAGLSTTINYFRDCFSAGTLDNLADATINAFNSINLNAVLYFHISAEQLMRSCNGEITSLEKELLKRFSSAQEPFFEQGERLFIVQKQLVVLIKNMPTDSDKRGSLKDHLMTLLEGCSAKLAHFSKLNETSGQKLQKIKRAIAEAQRTLVDIQAQEEQHKKRSMALVDDMIAEMEKSFFSMGLSDAQERELLAILSRTGQLQLEHMELGLELDERVKRCVIQLSKAATDALN